MGSCLTLRNELSKQTHKLTKQEIFLERGTWLESSRVREARRTSLPHGSQVQVLWGWDYFLGCLWPIVLTQGPFCWMHCSAKMDASEEDSGRWSDMWCHLLTFPELFWLVVAY